MSFLWNGLTESGNIVPIQVDAQGRVVAIDSSITPGIPEAPIDGKTYGRKDGAWVEVVQGVPDGVATAWGAVAGNGALLAGLNVSGVSQTGLGSYTVTFAKPLPSNAYSVTLGTELYGAALVSNSLTTTGFQFISYLADGTLTDGFTSFAVHSANFALLSGGNVADA